MNLKDIHRTYFIGIGGIGMSALARWFHAKEILVAGYDKTGSALTYALEEEGMSIHYQDDPKLIPEAFLSSDGTIVVFTPAIPKDHLELNYFKERGHTIKKRAEVLGIITENHYTIAVAGTHGKTTTCSMIAHLLSESKGSCSAFVGGIMTNTNSNLMIGDDDAPVVVEADEYDRSFMQLNPNYTVITSLDPDHLDIYGDATGMLEAYEVFAKKTPGNGKLLIQSNASYQINPGRRYTSYALSKGDIVAEAIRVENDAFVFTYRCGMEQISDIQLQVPGYHNVMNALAAITVALDMGMEGKEVQKRIKSYAGVKRRFEYVLKNSETTLIDDYAHHPEEIEAFLKSVRSLSEDRKITAIFQPHLYSRTNDLKKDFARALDKADDIILLEIYPAREKPMEGVSSKSIYDLMENKNKVMIDKKYLINELDNHKLDVVVTIGAGDIDREVPKVAEYMKHRFNFNHKTKDEDE
ncbi:MAG: UDP-N-acetylmuramate--L-alanine ligase [Bacteroidota bacterium]